MDGAHDPEISVAFVSIPFLLIVYSQVARR